MSTSSFWFVLSVVVLIGLCYNLFFVLFYEKVLFQGQPISDDQTYNFDFEFEELDIKPGSSVVLNGMLLKAEDSKGLILYFHGNKGNLYRWGKVGDKLRNFGHDVLIVDYRGYGKSVGTRSEQDLYKDAIYLYDYAKHELGYDNIIVYGRSLGSAIATDLATHRLPLHLILETPMTRLRDVIPVLEAMLLYKPWLEYKFNSIDKISKISCPISIIHGTNDAIVSYDQGVQLYEEIAHSDKKIITINQGKHNNLDTFDKYQQAIGQILE